MTRLSGISLKQIYNIQHLQKLQKVYHFINSCLYKLIHLFAIERDCMLVLSQRAPAPLHAIFLLRFADLKVRKLSDTDNVFFFVIVTYNLENYYL